MRKIKIGMGALGVLAALSFIGAFYVGPVLLPTVRAPLVYRLSHHQFPWDSCFTAYLGARLATGAARPLDAAGSEKVATACRTVAEHGDGPAATLMAEAEIGRTNNSEDGAKAAFGWLQRGADAGYGPAYLGLGIYHMVGRGTAKDAVKANTAMIAAANQGVALAQFIAARGYEHAIGTQQDYVRSLGWYTVLLRSSAKIREAGASQRELERTVVALKKHMSADQIAQAEAFANAHGD